MADPLDNLVPGPKGDRLAGREMLVEAIAEALVVDYADDDLVRREMGKAFDFVVTDAAREKLAAKKAAAVYEFMFAAIFDEVAAGGEVSINGFARFRPGQPNNLVDVKMVGGYPAPIVPGDVVVIEDRTAEVEAGSWAGENKALYVIPGWKFTGGYDDDGEQCAAVDNVIAGEFYKRMVSDNPGPWGFPHNYPLETNRLRVTAAGDDGVTREYFVGGLNIEVRGTMQRVYLPGGDYDVHFSSVPEPGRVIDAGVADGAGLGAWYRHIRAGEYGLLVERGIEGLTTRNITFESFFGYPAEVLLQFFPRKRRVVRSFGQVYDVVKITVSEFGQRFEAQRAYLQSVGAWPSRTRNFAATVECDFRQEFVDSLNVPAGAPA